MNLRQLRYFCEIVESGSSAQAAARLYVAATAVSAQLSQLEGELGGELFDRSRRPMELTALGRHFYPRAKELLTNAARLCEETQAIAAGQRGWLAIGFARSAMFSIVPNAVRRFREASPEVEIELLYRPSEQQPTELLTGRIQLGISRFVGSFDRVDGLTYTPLFEDPFVVALPCDHRLARRKVLKPGELDDVPFISYPRVPQTHYAEDTFALLRKAGGNPVPAYHADEINLALGMVASGLGFCLVGRSACEGSRSDISFVRLAGLPEVATIVAVTRASEENRIVSAFVSALNTHPLAQNVDQE
ncbi:LysR family transcriptional regulator [Paraburkholderia sp. Ac-20342]|uniref:LysR family transcriptional regulator n=1 Tax=Paraburkholderia sp. Ac-20342 TaxID=2703889 RepID=UPI00197EA7A5|nr:LysR family transcriptional regulator [Paraburkholderia sp. Ac-20342]MBN3846131.1 LysR family transcriptional regulator [Paraburkholderia sp. Ac-20342]